MKNEIEDDKFVNYLLIGMMVFAFLVMLVM